MFRVVVPAILCQVVDPVLAGELGARWVTNGGVEQLGHRRLEDVAALAAHAVRRTSQVRQYRGDRADRWTRPLGGHHADESATMRVLASRSTAS